MISYLLAGPAAEAVTLGEVKAWLRVDGDDEDGLIAGLIPAARLAITQQSGKALVSETWRLVCDDWPKRGELRLPVGPLRAVTGLRVFDAYDDAVELPLDGLVTAPEPALVIIPRELTPPVLRPRLGFEIDYEAGYASAAAVPAPLKQAVLTLIGHWYENRGLAESAEAVPAGIASMVAPFREMRL